MNNTALKSFEMVTTGGQFPIIQAQNLKEAFALFGCDHKGKDATGAQVVRMVNDLTREIASLWHNPWRTLWIASWYSVDGELLSAYNNYSIDALAFELDRARKGDGVEDIIEIKRAIYNCIGDIKKLLEADELADAVERIHGC